MSKSILGLSLALLLVTGCTQVTPTQTISAPPVVSTVPTTPATSYKPTSKQVLYAIESAYTLITQDEVSYKGLPNADPLVVTQMKTVDAVTYSALVQYREAVKAGKTPLPQTFDAIRGGLNQLSADLFTSNTLTAKSISAVNTAVNLISAFTGV